MRQPYSLKVYRYMSFKRFCELLFNQELALVNPSKWPDQYETYILRELKDTENRAKFDELFDEYGIPFEQCFDKLLEVVEAAMEDTYCLCFTRSKDSEVMWNAYSFQNNAIMIRTSVEKLLSLAPESLSAFRVRYDLKNADINFLLDNCFFDDSSLVIKNCDEMLRHKRKCFLYENELRLVGSSFCEVSHRCNNGVMYLPINDISYIIERVMVHPLADDGYVALIEKMCRHFGIKFWGRSKIYEFKGKKHETSI